MRILYVRLSFPLPDENGEPLEGEFYDEEATQKVYERKAKPKAMTMVSILVASHQGKTPSGVL